MSAKAGDLLAARAQAGAARPADDRRAERGAARARGIVVVVPDRAASRGRRGRARGTRRARRAPRHRCVDAGLAACPRRKPAAHCVLVVDPVFAPTLDLRVLDRAARLFQLPSRPGRRLAGAPARAWAVAHEAVVSDGDASATRPATRPATRATPPCSRARKIHRTRRPSARSRRCSACRRRGGAFARRVVAVGLLRSAFPPHGRVLGGRAGPGAPLCALRQRVRRLAHPAGVLGGGHRRRSRASPRGSAPATTGAASPTITQAVSARRASTCFCSPSRPWCPRCTPRGWVWRRRTLAYELGRAHLQRDARGVVRSCAVGPSSRRRFAGWEKRWWSKWKSPSPSPEHAHASDARAVRLGPVPAMRRRRRGHRGRPDARSWARERHAALMRACGVTLRFAPPRRRERRWWASGCPWRRRARCSRKRHRATEKRPPFVGPHHLAATRRTSRRSRSPVATLRRRERDPRRPVAPPFHVEPERSSTARRRAGAGGPAQSSCTRRSSSLKKTPPGSCARRGRVRGGAMGREDTAVPTMGGATRCFSSPSKPSPRRRLHRRRGPRSRCWSPRATACTAVRVPIAHYVGTTTAGAGASRTFATRTPRRRWSRRSRRRVLPEQGVLGAISESAISETGDE